MPPSHAPRPQAPTGGIVPDPLDDGFGDELDGGPEDGLEGARHLRLTVPDRLAGMRLDRALADLVAEGAAEDATGASAGGTDAQPLSRTRLKALMDRGMVRLDGGRAADASLRVRAGQSVEVVVPAPVAALPEPEAIPLAVAYEDDDLLVVDKPAGMVVHPAAGNPRGTLVNALLAHCGDRLSGIGGVRRPGIVHRLDKDTSGLMVVAKTDRAHAGLTSQFQDRSLSRTYLALVAGLPSPAAGTVDAPIGRSPTDRKRMAVVAAGKPAVTHWRTLKGYGTVCAWVECRLETGRTHQIRVHMTHVGHPLVGDPLYGRGRAGRQALAKFRTLPEPAASRLVAFSRQALHAAEIRFIHPRTAEGMRFASELPAELRELTQCLESI